MEGGCLRFGQVRVAGQEDSANRRMSAAAVWDSGASGTTIWSRSPVGAPGSPANPAAIRRSGPERKPDRKRCRAPEISHPAACSTPRPNLPTPSRPMASRGHGTSSTTSYRSAAPCFAPCISGLAKKRAESLTQQDLHRRVRTNETGTQPGARPSRQARAVSNRTSNRLQARSACASLYTAESGGHQPCRVPA